MAITIIPAASLDKKKWDQMIDSDPNRCIYARYEYLNLLCDQWSAIVLNDYHAVWPLPWRKKWGMRYYYQPAFVQQLGLFGSTSDAELALMVDAMKRFALLGDLTFHGQQHYLYALLPLQRRPNFVLPAYRGITYIRSEYRSAFRKSLQKASGHPLLYRNDLDHEWVIRQYQASYGARMPQVSTSDYAHFIQLCDHLHQEKNCLVRFVSTADHHEPLAAVILLRDGKRLYNICNIISDQGRDLGANHWLFDQVLEEFSEQDYLLDLEGSSLPGVAFFYASLGAINEPYYLYERSPLISKFRQLLRGR